jgi:hypothetical protein
LICGTTIPLIILGLKKQDLGSLQGSLLSTSIQSSLD